MGDAIIGLIYASIIALFLMACSSVPCMPRKEANVWCWDVLMERAPPCCSDLSWCSWDMPAEGCDESCWSDFDRAVYRGEETIDLLPVYPEICHGD